MNSGVKKEDLQADKVSSLFAGYATWIKNNYPTSESAHMECREAVVRMTSAFPELEPIKGHVYVGTNYRSHWWCQDKVTKKIIDPTAHQWGNGICKYQEHTGPEPHGECLYCGALLFDHEGADYYLCRACMTA